MRKFLQRVFEDIKQGENIDLVVTIVLGIVIAILNSVGQAPPTLVSSITLATLGLLAIGMLISRYKLDDIYKKEKTKDTVQLSNVELASLQSLLQSSDEIWMVGLFLRNTTTDNYYSFKKRVGDGIKIRVMIVNLKSVQLEKVVKRFSRAGKKEHFLSDMEHVVNEYMDISRSAPDSDNVQLRLLDFVPSFSMYIFPKKNNNGLAIIESYCYKSAKGSIPKFQVSERENPEWYRHFVEQYELMWKDTSKIDLYDD